MTAAYASRCAKGKNVRTSQNCPRPRYKRTRDTGYDARATEPQNPRGGRAASRSATADVDLEIDPVASGFAASFARPGGNITGLFFDAPGIVAKWLQALAEILPGMKNAAVLWSPASGQWQLESLKAAARALSITLEVLELRDPAELEALLAAALKKRPQALIQLSSPIISQFQGRVAEFTQQHRLPAISMYTACPERGGLMSYGPDLPVFSGAPRCS